MDVTVGICAYNEGKNIGSLLHNVLHQQDLTADSEVLVVCSGCTDNTLEIVLEYARKDSRVKLAVEEERRGKASAVNKVFANAKKEVIVFASADTLPDKGCFSKLVSELNEAKVGLVCAHPVPINSSRFLPGKMVQILWGLHDQVFRQLSDSGQAKHASEVFCIRKDILDSIPAETVNDDAYIALMTIKKGWIIRYEPHAIVYIRGPETMPDYFRQRRRVIFGHHQVKKLTGESPQYFTALFGSSSGLRNLLSSLFVRDKMLSLLPFGSIELLSNAAATTDVLLKKSHSKWKISTTTKTAILVTSKLPKTFHSRILVSDVSSEKKMHTTGIKLPARVD